jgi:hypothetical protein
VVLSNRIRLAVVGSALFVGCLTVLVDFGPQSAGAPVFYVLFPGLVVSILLTGAHGGGTHAVDIFGEIVGFLLNFLIYIPLFWLALHWRYAKKKRYDIK